MKNLPLTKTELNYSLSTLHAWIRTMECLLKISYKLTIKKWTTREPSEKKIIQDRKALIQQKLCDEVGLLIDIPRPGGSGSSNNCYTG